MNNISKEKILITGSTGMVGSAIYRAFLNEEKSKNYINSKEFLIPTREDLDLCNYEKVESWFSENKPDTVVIAAAKVGGINANQNFPTEFILQNIQMQTNLIDISHKFKVKKLLFLASSCVYPKFAKQPIKEEELLNGKLEPTSEYYALAKISGIKLCEALKIQYGFNAISLIPPNLFGPNDKYTGSNSHVLPALISKFYEAKQKSLKNVTCWGSGQQLREFLFVEDLADACLFSINNWDQLIKENAKGKNGELLSWLNVGSNIEISIKDLALRISDILGYDGEIIWDKSKPDGNPRKKLNWERFERLGWHPKTSLDEGLKISINDFIKRFKKY